MNGRDEMGLCTKGKSTGTLPADGVVVEQVNGPDVTISYSFELEMLGVMSNGKEINAIIPDKVYEETHIPVPNEILYGPGLLTVGRLNSIDVRTPNATMHIVGLGRLKVRDIDAHKYSKRYPVDSGFTNRFWLRIPPPPRKWAFTNDALHVVSPTPIL
ncbi:MAG: hypothetical protein C0404_09820 [Verrucomicrobia bacterium]|nr:hypothetical protein [Verrucomicrobiota bacterium]